MRKDVDFFREADDISEMHTREGSDISDVIQEMPEDIPEDIPGTVLQNSPENVLEDIAEDVPQHITEGGFHDTREDMPEDIPEDTLDQAEPPGVAGGSVLENDLSTPEGQLNSKIQEIVENENLTTGQKRELLLDIQAQLLGTQGADAAVVDTSEGNGPALTLKRDELTQLKMIYEGVQDTLEVKADDYRDKGYSEKEIAELLAQDERTYLKEDLDTAFPGQDISPDVFNAFGRKNRTANDSDADVQPLSDIDGWLGDINPNFDAFDPESPYCNNCGSCALAVYNRLNGDTDACATAENIGYNDEMNALTGMEQVAMSPEDIESRLLEEGDGAHAIIGIDRAEGPGHWFNAACVDGKVVAIDGQSGEVMDWPPDYGDVVNWEMSVEKED